jgi:hypothetical protein
VGFFRFRVAASVTVNQPACLWAWHSLANVSMNNLVFAIRALLKNDRANTVRARQFPARTRIKFPGEVGAASMSPLRSGLLLLGLLVTAASHPVSIAPVRSRSCCRALVASRTLHGMTVWSTLQFGHLRNQCNPTQRNPFSHIHVGRLLHGCELGMEQRDIPTRLI